MTIAVIVVLVSLLLPAIAQAKESARTVLCMNNGKQMAMATAFYAEDNRGRIPSFNNWLFTRMTQQKVGAITMSVSDLKTGRLYPYLKTKDIYFCPTDRNEMRHPRAGTPRIDRGAGFGGGNGYRENSYAMNCQICHHNNLATWKTPSKTVLFAEAWLGPRDRSGIFSPAAPQMVGKTPEYLAFRHAKKAMAITGDLSAQMLPRKRFTRLTPDFWDPGAGMGTGGRLE